MTYTWPFKELVRFLYKMLLGDALLLFFVFLISLATYVLTQFESLLYIYFINFKRFLFSPRPFLFY